MAIEESSEFNVLGKLIGLAVYNGVILDIHFPAAFYKKLNPAKNGDIGFQVRDSRLEAQKHDNPKETLVSHVLGVSRKTCCYDSSKKGQAISVPLNCLSKLFLR